MKTKTLFAVILVLFAIRPAWSQSANVGPGPSVFGYLNSRTDTFRPLFLNSVVTHPQAISIATGKVTVSFTITIQSAIATTTPISCDVTAALADIDSSGNIDNYITEDAAVTASRTGSTATCTVTIPYSWNLSFRSTDQVEFDYTISAVPTTGGGLPRRTGQQTIAIKSIPANGVITSLSVKATI